jgi:hypothetical protein
MLDTLVRDARAGSCTSQQAYDTCGALTPESSEIEHHRAWAPVASLPYGSLPIRHNSDASLGVSMAMHPTRTIWSAPVARAACCTPQQGAYGAVTPRSSILEPARNSASVSCTGGALCTVPASPRSARHSGRRVRAARAASAGSLGSSAARSSGLGSFLGFSSRDGVGSGDGIEEEEPYRSLAENEAAVVPYGVPLERHLARVIFRCAQHAARSAQCTTSADRCIASTGGAWALQATS